MFCYLYLASLFSNAFNFSNKIQRIPPLPLTGSSTLLPPKKSNSVLIFSLRYYLYHLFVTEIIDFLPLQFLRRQDVISDCLGRLPFSEIPTHPSKRFSFFPLPQRTLIESLCCKTWLLSQSLLFLHPLVIQYWLFLSLPKIIYLDFKLI